MIMKKLLLGTLCMVALSAQAAYPDKPVRLIVPLSAGGGMDTVTRAVAAPLGERLGQSVVVDNRPGGGGAIGAELTKDAPKDGHTLLMASATFVIHPQLYPARYRPTTEYTAITQVTR
jgi:tripartite-type tricarboxylate transporter receptor subunit TctC